MNQYEMVVLIVDVIFIARTIRERNRLRAATPPPDDAVPALIAEVARLRERVQVLERIATDDSRRLAVEIDNLNR